MASAPTERRPSPRSTEQVTAQVVQAAGALFAELGYAQTTLRAVASKAGISLSVLYRHFPSKEHLFSATLVAPFISSFEQFGKSWADQVDGTWDEERLNAFIRDLYDNLVEHRRTVVSLLGVAEDPGTELIDDVRSALGAAWGGLRSIGPQRPGLSPSLTAEEVRDSNMLLVALVTGLAVFRPFVAAARGGEVTDLVDLAGRFATYGLLLRPPVRESPGPLTP